MQKLDAITFRNAVEQDCDVLSDMCWNALRSHSETNDGFYDLKTKEHCKDAILNVLKNSIKNHDSIILVAFDGSKVVGVAIGHTQKRDLAEFYQVETIGKIRSVMVLPEYEKSDIKKNLMERLLEELYKTDIKFVEVRVPSKDQSIDLYQSLGFVHTSVMLLQGKTVQRTFENTIVKDRDETIRHNPYGRGKATIPFIVKVKPASVMGEYIALHGLVPQNELPEHLRYQIPEDEIWIREDVYDDPIRREQILNGHEKFELGLMETKGLTYKQAHRIAELHEQVYKIEEELAHMENEMRIIPYEPVKFVFDTISCKSKRKDDASVVLNNPSK